jgi:hypothetical protein
MPSSAKTHVAPQSALVPALDQAAIAVPHAGNSARPVNRFFAKPRHSRLRASQFTQMYRGHGQVAKFPAACRSAVPQHQETDRADVHFLRQPDRQW